MTKETFTFQLDKAKLKDAELRDGHYLLRTNLVGEDPAVLWDRYMQLTQIEAAFKCLKSDLGIRPIYHQLEHRVDAHILVAFLAYCLTVTLKHRLQEYAPGLTPRAVLEKLATIQMLDVSFPTTDGRRLTMPRYTEPDAEQALLLHHLKLVLPPQPPPRISMATSPATRAPTQNVVETFGMPLLKIKDLLAVNPLNCESQVSGRSRSQSPRLLRVDLSPATRRSQA